MAKKARRKSTLRSAGNVTANELREKARALADNPDLAAPRCAGACVFLSPIKQARQQIAKIHAHRDDPGYLNKAAKRGNELARAYAATLQLRDVDEIPYVAEFRMGTERVPYVMRGNAKPFYLVGLQHYDDRALRLLSVGPFVKKRGIYVFSTDDGLVCTGKRALPPSVFVTEEARALDLSPHPDDASRFVCEHGGADAVGTTPTGGEMIRAAIVLSWTAANVRFERCARCARDSMAGTLIKHMAGPTLYEQFSVDVVLSAIDNAVGETPEVAWQLGKDIGDAYRRGSLPDTAVVTAAQAARLSAVAEWTWPWFIAGDQSYGDDVDEFLEALAASPAETAALRPVLAARDRPLVLTRASSARALAAVWPDHGEDLLRHAGGDDAVARYHTAEVTPESAADLVRRAFHDASRERASADLPSYDKLSPVMHVVDTIARAFRLQGQAAAARVAKRIDAPPTAGGAVLALLQAMDADASQRWRFRPIDSERAEALAAVARDLLHQPPDAYDGVLQAFATACGEAAPQKR